MHKASLLVITLISLSFLYPIFFSLGLITGGATFFFALSKYKTKEKSLILLLFFICLTFPSVMYFSSSQYNISSATVTILGSLFGYALSLSRDKNLSIFCWLPLFLLILIIGTKYLLGAAPSDLFPKNGGNYASISLFGAYLSYFILSKDFTINATHVVFLFFVLVLCILSQGRSGAALALVLFTSSLYIVVAKTSGDFSPSLRRIIKFIKLIIISSLLAYLLLNLLAYYQDEGGLEKLLSRALYNNPREYLISEYLKIMNLESVFFGLNVFDHHQLGEYGFNLHNNYLELHSKFGLPLLVLYFFMIVRVLLYLFNKKLYFLIIVLLVFFTRAYTDIQLMIGRFDYILFFFFFYFIIPSKSPLKI